MRPSNVLVAGLAVFLASACAAFSEAEAVDTENALTDVTEPVPIPPSTPPPSDTTTSTTAPTTPAPVACSATASRQTCAACCEEKLPDFPAAREAINQAWLTCACAPARCAEACKVDLCATRDENTPTSSACNECLDSTDTCDEAADDALMKLVTRVDFTACLTANDCAAKPWASGG